MKKKVLKKNMISEGLVFMVQKYFSEQSKYAQDFKLDWRNHESRISKIEKKVGIAK